MKEQLLEEIKNLNPELIALRRDFHQYPELGFQEHRTSEKVEEYLKNLGIPTMRMAGTGVVGLIDSGKPGKTLLLRADMDALPVTEATGLDFSSKNQGVMHACGHDGHVAMLLIAAKILVHKKNLFTGKIKLVFQPNEEEEGAVYLIKEGVLENPAVDSSFGVHLWSQLPSGVIGLQSGPVMGEMFIFKMELQGKGGHTSAPHQGKDTILCAANIIQSVQAIQTREISSLEPTTIVFGKVIANGAYNIIPEKTVLEGTLRYLYDGEDDTPQHPRKRFSRIVNGICAAHDISCNIEFTPSNYTVINHPDSVDFLKEQVLPNIVESSSVKPYQCMAGEDFSEFTNRANVPGALVFIGTGNPRIGSDKPHHAPDFTIDEDTLATGVQFHVFTALNYLK